MLLLFRLGATGVGDVGQFSYAQYMEVTDAVYDVYRLVGCVWPQRATADKVDRTFEIANILR